MDRDYEEKENSLLEDAIQYLREKTYPNVCPMNRKRVIRKKASKLRLVDGEVYVEKNGGKLVKYIMTKKEQLRITMSCHMDPTSGHLGIKKTYYRITERFTWNGVMKDVQEVVSACDECQRVKDKVQTTKPELHPVPVKSTWHHIGIDFIGPISPVSKSGNKYILTVSDYFSKWVCAFPLPSKEAVGVANTLFKLFMTMGLPRVITSDQGKEFKNLLNAELMKQFGIKHHLTTPYHPQANGLDERFNQTLQKMIVKYCNSNGKDTWDEHLESCTFAYNTSRQESSLYTPFEVMFGRKAVLPVDCEEGLPFPPLHSGVCMEAAVSTLTNNRQCILKEVKENISKAQLKQKQQYDLKHCNPCKFKIGVYVLMKDFRRKKRKGGKLDYKWLGPYRVTHDCGKGFFSLSDVTNHKKILIKRVNGAHLKIYKSPIPTTNISLLTAEPSKFSSATASSKSSTVNVSSQFSPQDDVSNLTDSVPPLPPPLPFFPESADISSPIIKQNPPLKKIVSKKVKVTAFKQRQDIAASSKSSTVNVSSQFSPQDDVSNLTDSVPPLPPPLTFSWCFDSVPSLHGVASSTMIEEAGYIPPFFPEFADIPSPIFKQNPPPKKVVSKKTVKLTAFKQRQDVRQKKRLGCNAQKLNVIDLAKVSPQTIKQPKQWVSGLTIEDEHTLLTGGWLSDKLINAGQVLIRRHSSQVLGFQDVALGHTLGFDVYKGEFVQVLHTGRGHWVTVSTIGCGTAEMDVFDSMCPGVTDDLQKQIAALLCTKEDVITVRYKQCQQQDGSADCGLFALAFAAVLTSGDHPSAYHFDQQSMRKHLHGCITTGSFSPFPTKRIGRENKKFIRMCYTIPVYCNCRMPKTFSEKMICCSKCRHWFHLDLCVVITGNIEKSTKWFCNNC